MWQTIIGGIILILLGIWEGYSVFYYMESKASKSIPMAPMIIYSSVAVSIVLVGVGIDLMLNHNPLLIIHKIYRISGIALIIVALLIYWRGFQTSKKLKKGQSKIKIYQTYWISLMILISGIVSLFSR